MISKNRIEEACQGIIANLLLKKVEVMPRRRNGKMYTDDEWLSFCLAFIFARLSKTSQMKTFLLNKLRVLERDQIIWGVEHG